MNWFEPQKKIADEKNFVCLLDNLESVIKMAHELFNENISRILVHQIYKSVELTCVSLVNILPFSSTTSMVDVESS